MTSRRFALIAAAFALLMTAAPAAATTIVFYHYQAAGNATVLRAILDEFERANPDVTVREVFKQSEQITAELQAAIAARRPVDLAQVIGKNIIFHLSNLPAAPLNEDPRANEWLARYLPQFLDIGRVGERIYAIPHSYGTPLLFANLDLFRDAGLDSSHLPQTWDEVVQAAQQITARTGRPSFVHLTASMRDYGTMLMVTNAGGGYLAPDGRRALFDSPQGIAALQLWQDLVVRYRVAPIMNDQQMTAAFQSGQIAMFIQSSAALRPFAAAAEGRFALGVAQYPTFAGQPRRVPNSGAAIMMFAPPGPRREATLRLLEFLSRREIANRWARETGYMPLSVDPLADPDMARYVESFPLVRPAIAQMAETVDTARWPARGAIEAQIEVSNLIDALWAGRGPASALVPPAVARINETLRRFNP